MAPKREVSGHFCMQLVGSNAATREVREEQHKVPRR